MNMLPLVLLVAAVVAATVAVWGFLAAARERARASAAEARLQQAGVEIARLEERSRHIEQTSARVEDAFKVMSAEAMEKSTEALLKRAEEAFQSRDRLAQERLSKQLAPVAETLTRFEEKVGAMEKARAEEAGGIKAQIESLMQASTATQTEARRLTDALKRAPGVRGRWGEQTLRNVLEAAGMVGRVDFVEQHSVAGEEGALRPDVIVRMPGGGVLVIDSKVSLNDYLAALEHTDELAREASMKAHAASVRRHMNQLSSKAYWAQFDRPPHSRSPDVVAMFVPLESCMACVLERDPDIMREAWEKRITIVTPTGLFPLLKAVAYGWRAEEQAANAAEVAELGKVLYQRLSVMGSHVVQLGKALDQATGKYNQFVGSLEGQVLTQARRFEALSVDHADKTIPELVPLEGAARPLIKLAAGSETAGAA
jgi:DNA recombination protein RmuC